MTRQDQIEAAARELIALEDGEFLKLYDYERESAIGAEKAKLRAALALPADPVSVDERERALVRAGLAVVYPDDMTDSECDEVIGEVNATHPRAPSVEAAVYERDVLLSAIDALVAYNDGDATLKGVPGAGALARARDTVVTHRAISPEGQVIYRALAPVAHVAPSEAPACCCSCREDDPPCPVHDLPRWGGGLREWFSRVLRNAAERGLIVSQETGIDAALAEVGPPPPTDGVAAAYEGCNGLDTPERVRFYEHDFYPLSNFSAFNVKIDGIRFDTSEAAYHCFKFPEDPSIQDVIRNAPSAHEAFKLAERYRTLRRADWDAVKVDVMRRILRAKAEQHEYVKRKLLATGDRELVEDSWRDDFWGWGPNRDGKNMLGKLWMELRAELRALAPVSEKERAK